MSESRFSIPALVVSAGSAGPHGAAGEGVAVDSDGNVYAAEGPISRAPAARGLTKYTRR